MAIFNPGVPETQPKDYRESRPISQGASSSLGGEAFKVAGDLVTATVKGTDQIVKDDIEKGIYADVDRERDAYIADLETVKAGVQTGKITSPDETADVPTELQDVGRTVGELRDAKQAGKVSNTQYDGTLLSIAKEWRRKYPGYREYIDSEVSKASGIPVANSYAAGLLADINRDLASRGAKSDKIQALIIQDREFPDSEKMFAQWAASDKSQAEANKIFAWSAQNQQYKAKLQLNALERADTEGDLKVQGVRSEQQFGLVATHNVKAALNATNLPNGLSVAEIQRRVIASNNGTAPQLTPEQSQQFLSQAVGAKQTANLNIDKWLYDTQDGKVKSPAMTMTPEKIKELKSTYLAPFDGIVDSITNKDTGSYHFYGRMISGATDQAKIGLLNHPDLGAQTRILSAINSLAPDFAKQFTANSMLQAKYPEALNNFITQEGMLAGSGYDVRKGEKPTLAVAIDSAIAKGATGFDTHSALVDNISIITDPKLKATDQVKASAAMYFFGPGNQNVLAKFPDDVRPVPGQPMRPGKAAIFAKMTTDDVAEEMFRLGKKDPRIWQAYTNWTNTQFSTQLFDRQIKNMSSIKLDDNLKLGFDPERSQFTVYRKDLPSKDLLTTKGGTANNAFAGPSQYAKDTLNTLNTGLHSMATIGKLAGYDTNAYLFTLLARANPGIADKDSMFYQAFNAAQSAKKPDPTQRGPR